MRYHELMQLIVQYGADREKLGEAISLMQAGYSLGTKTDLLEDAIEEKLLEIRGVVRRLYIDAGEERE